MSTIHTKSDHFFRDYRNTVLFKDLYYLRIEFFVTSKILLRVVMPNSDTLGIRVSAVTKLASSPELQGPKTFIGSVAPSKLGS